MVAMVEMVEMVKVGEVGWQIVGIGGVKRHFADAEKPTDLVKIGLTLFKALNYLSD